MAESVKNTTDEMKQIEKEEEAKLIAKYPSVARPGPAFLQKRLQKGQKFFDSGDYNMAKAAVKKLPASALSHNSDSITITGPTDASNSSTGSSSVSPISPINLPILPTGDSIPSPDYLATRKSSINVQSKLAIGTS